MLNQIEFYTTFIFIFSLLATIRLTVGFFKSFLSDPPKPFEITNIESITHGLFITYIITFLIYQLS
jgi:hypothetical protein